MKSKSSKYTRPIQLLLMMFFVIVGPIALVWVWGKLLTLSQTIGGHSQRLSTAEIVGACALVGFLTSTLLQIIKEQTQMRARVHMDAVREWLTRRHELSSEEKASRRWSIEKAGEQIEILCAAGATGEDDFYNLSTKQFCGQIASSVDLVMMEPAAYPDFFAALTSGGDYEHKKDTKIFQSSTDEVTSKQVNVEGEETDHEQDRIRARMIHYAQRALDGLQIQAARRWKLRLLFTCVWVSVGVSLGVAMGVTPPVDIWEIPNLFYVTGIFAVAGTLLAPVAYDITTAIRGLGRR